MHVRIAPILALLLTLLPATLVAAEEPDIAWTQQFGTNRSDVATAVAVDANGNVYVVGETDGVLPGQTRTGSFDAFVRKYDANGSEQWTRQFGSIDLDFARGVAVDPNGNVYVAGQTLHALPGQVRAGLSDAFVRKYDMHGVEQWTHQFGSIGTEDVGGVAVDPAGTVYVVGDTNRSLLTETGLRDRVIFLRAYDANGAEQWTREFGGTEWVWARGLAIGPAGHIYVAGQTDGILPGQTTAGNYDVFVRQYDSGGIEQWTRQFGSDWYDDVGGVAVDADGNVDVVGFTHTALPGQTSVGSIDAFVRQYDADGAERWTRQFGTDDDDHAHAVAVDADGNIYVAGVTDGILAGQTTTAPGYNDAFVRQYDASGAEQWTRQFGVTNNRTSAFGVAVDSSGHVDVVGSTNGILPGQTPFGSSDAFARQYSVGDIVTPPPADTTPPVLTVPDDITVEATGPDGASVDYAGSVSAVDDVDGPVTVNCAPSSGSIFPPGSTTVVCMATDAAGNDAIEEFSVAVRDTIPPVLVLPSAMTADATGPDGAIVSFTVSATDIADLNPTVACLPGSDSAFVVGTTTVTCTATDASGNSAAGTFEVTIAGASEQLSNLITTIGSFNLGHGPTTSFTSKLQSALEAFDAGDASTACNALTDFDNHVGAQSGKKLTVEQAENLLSASWRIKAVIGCS